MQLPQTALAVSLLGMCLIVAVRYLAISGLFHLSSKKLRPDVYVPTDPKKAAAGTIRADQGKDQGSLHAWSPSGPDARTPRVPLRGIKGDPREA